MKMVSLSYKVKKKWSIILLLNVMNVGSAKKSPFKEEWLDEKFKETNKIWIEYGRKGNEKKSK